VFSCRLYAKNDNKKDNENAALYQAVDYTIDGPAGDIRARNSTKEKHPLTSTKQTCSKSKSYKIWIETGCATSAYSSDESKFQTAKERFDR